MSFWTSITVWDCVACVLKCY